MRSSAYSHHAYVAQWSSWVSAGWGSSITSGQKPWITRITSLTICCPQYGAPGVRTKGYGHASRSVYSTYRAHPAPSALHPGSAPFPGPDTPERPRSVPRPPKLANAATASSLRVPAQRHVILRPWIHHARKPRGRQHVPISYGHESDSHSRPAPHRPVDQAPCREDIVIRVRRHHQQNARAGAIAVSDGVSRNHLRPQRTS